MPWWLESDTFHSDPAWWELAGGDADRVDALQAAHSRLMSAASHHTSDGYLTEHQVLEQCRRRRKVVDLLATSVLGQPPRLHRRGDECECLDAAWPPGYGFRIHRFLKKNPSRSEYNRNRAQKADLRSAELKHRVYGRDGGCCRYCRSGPLSAKAGRARDRRKHLTYDHVDPDAPAGADGANLVVCCARCNEYKGHRTPPEADMVLLPEPSQSERMAWSQREQQLFDQPVQSPTDHRPITDKSLTDHRNDGDSTTDRITDPIGERTADPTPVTAGEDRPRTGEQNTDQPPTSTGRPPGLGRGPAITDNSHAPGGDQPARTQEYPDVYHRRSRGRARSPTAPDPPPILWPPGTTRTRPADPST